MKVFLSSVIVGYEAIRDEAARGITALGFEVLRAENFTASADTPKQACLQGVRQSDLVVLILGATYGPPQLSGLSATHEEYRDARDSRPVLVFIEEDVERDPRQKQFVEEVDSWDSGQFIARFAGPGDLSSKVTQALHRYALTEASTHVDLEEVSRLATSAIPARSSTPLLTVVIAGGPIQSIIKPSRIESDDFSRFVAAEALTGEHAVMDISHGTQRAVTAEGLTLAQPSSGSLLQVQETGCISVSMPAAFQSDRRNLSIAMIVEEDLHGKIVCSFSLANRILDEVDSTHKLTQIVPAVGVTGGSYLAWKTRAEYDSDSRSATISMHGTDSVVAQLSPPGRRRATMSQQKRDLADDLVVRIRRTFKS